jgi:hypothetical protein
MVRSAKTRASPYEILVNIQGNNRGTIREITKEPPTSHPT